MAGTWARRAAVFVSKATDPWINLAFEDWLFRKQTQTRYQLMLYRNSPCVVVGRNQNPWRECNVKLLEAEGVPIIRRMSGGGTVYHDMGNTNYSVTMPRDEFDRRKSAEMVTCALQELDIPANVNVRHDIVVDEQKVSGSAFKLVGKRAYHHGTMLIDCDPERMSKYLKGIDEGVIVGRGVESVRSKVTSLRNYSYTVTHTSFCETVIDHFVRTFGWDRYDAQRVPTLELTMDDFHASREAQETYHQIKSWDWTFGQTPDFTHTVNLGTDKSVVVHVNEGLVAKVVVVDIGISNSADLASDASGWPGQIAWIGKRYGSDIVAQIKQALA